MKTKFGIVGCGFLGNIVADAWKNGLLPDYELVGVTSRTRASAEKISMPKSRLLPWKAGPRCIWPAVPSAALTCCRPSP